jgi:hypothetical protein
MAVHAEGSGTEEIAPSPTQSACENQKPNGIALLWARSAYEKLKA